MAQKRLMSELAALRKEKWVHLEVDESNLYFWRIGLMVVNPESVFNGAYFQAEMRFTKDYPYQPPSFKFSPPNALYHPNVYPNGNLCISILHKPGEDERSGEQACERWSPLQGVESVLRSVLLLLDDPEIGSPANVDAGVLYRNDQKTYNAKAKESAAESREGMPKEVHYPTADELANAALPQQMQDDDNFWNDSDGEFGSGSDLDFDGDDDDD